MRTLTPKRSVPLVRALACTLLACALAACGGRLGEGIRRSTYPPDFQYIPASTVESTMKQLGVHATRLDRLLAAAPPAPGEIERLLLQMEEASRALGPGGWPSNHPRISRNIESFRRDLVAARRAVKEKPPSFLLAREVTHACTTCHRGR